MEPTVYITPTPWYKRKLLWIFLLVLILIPVGFYVFKTYFLKTPQIKQELNESELPIALDILKNPAIYQWTGSVEGTLTAKDEVSLTITTKDNQSITIPLDLSPNGTKFYSNKPGSDLRAKSLTVDDIPIGSNIRGDFFIIPSKKHEMRAGSFVIMEP